jgi:hypothetical protein
MAGEENFLSRWSRRKAQAATSPEQPTAKAGAVPPPTDALPAPGGPAPPAPAEAAPLPSLESLTTESDYAPFMAPEVDGETRRKALKTLFTDPRFNVMDMMDVYVDDYSKPDPIPASWLENLQQLSRLGDRAGRDREEEERRRALAEEQAAETRVPPVDAPPAAIPPGVARTAEAGPAESPRDGVRAPGAEAQFPPPALGESGS